MSEKIYESPDGGKTVYSREIGKTEKTLEWVDSDFMKSLAESMELEQWRDILKEAEKSETLKKDIERVKITYHLIKNHGRRI
jgi:hypothetical protein